MIHPAIQYSVSRSLRWHSYSFFFLQNRDGDERRRMGDFSGSRRRLVLSDRLACRPVLNKYASINSIEQSLSFFRNNHVLSFSPPIRLIIIIRPRTTIRPLTAHASRRRRVVRRLLLLKHLDDVLARRRRGRRLLDDDGVVVPRRPRPLVGTRRADLDDFLRGSPSPATAVSTRRSRRPSSSRHDLGDYRRAVVAEIADDAAATTSTG